MKFNKGQKVLITESKLIKTIIDCEIICDVEIYYMSDNTSYSLSQLSEDIFNREETLINLLKKNKDKIIRLINFDKVSSNAAKNYVKKMKELKLR